MRGRDQRRVELQQRLAAGEDDERMTGACSGEVVSGSPIRTCAKSKLR